MSRALRSYKRHLIDYGFKLFEGTNVGRFLRNHGISSTQQKLSDLYDDVGIFIGFGCRVFNPTSKLSKQDSAELQRIIQSYRKRGLDQEAIIAVMEARARKEHMNILSGGSE